MKRTALLRVLAFSLLIIQAAQPAHSQTKATSQTASDPQALALASQAIAAMTGGASIQDVALTGTETTLLVLSLRLRPSHSKRWGPTMPELIANSPTPLRSVRPRPECLSVSGPR